MFITLPVGITAEYARPLRKAASRRDNDQVKPRYPVLVKNIPRGTCWQVNELRLSASWPELTFITRHLGTQGLRTIGRGIRRVLQHRQVQKDRLYRIPLSS